MEQNSNPGLLPGRVSLRSLSFAEWDLHLVVPPRDILHRPGEALSRSHVELVRLLRKLLRRIFDVFSVSLDSDIDMGLLFVTGGSVSAILSDVVLDGWKGSPLVCDEALLL